jgi:GNAT superfamily N-acetyltransferase
VSAPELAYPLVDLALARRLERAEALSNIAFVEAHARLDPAVGAAWREIAGTCAMFDGVGSPCTQTFGLGAFAPVRAEVLSELEHFFQSRGAAVHHEVSPLADTSVLELLPSRGYHPIEFSSVMYRPAAAVPDSETSIRVRVIAHDEAELWAETAAAGWRDVPAVADLVYDLGVIVAHTHGTDCMLAELDGRPIAAGAISIREGVALMAGASTIPEWRGRGAQNALFSARLRCAAGQGADLAMIVAQPGSASQRNAERQGFRIAYTRTKWELRSNRT